MDNFTFLGILFVPIVLLSFLITLIAVPLWIKRAKREKLTGKDVHKLKSGKIAEAGGIAVIGGVVIGVFLYVALKTFFFGTETNLIHILGLLCVIFFATIVGVFDDLLGWKRGLSNKLRIGLLFFAAIPLMALGAGTSTILGIDFGLLYPLILIPIAIVGTTSTFNFLAGYNGLEASQGILVLGALSIVTFLTGALWLSVISACMVASLLAFYFFNKYPAKIFPGDTLTYPVGALIGAIAILGNIEKIAIFFFIPYIIEFFLKARGKLKKESFGKLNKDSSIDIKEGIYGLEHVAIALLKKVKPSHKAYEWEVPMLINLFQILVIVVGFWLFF
ncbi:glycosyl transferase family 4 [Candidatus Pacearchaeota archaeon]|nr:glycosyl transferase family 4 [Candidatus Pacearchaeota archaeon]